MRELLRPLVLLSVLAALSFAVAACGGDDPPATEAEGTTPTQSTEAGSTTPPTESTEAGGTTPTESTEAGGTASTGMECGLSTGEEATGTPIKVGSIVTNIPGLELTDTSNAAAAFFECVNDNGGINGHPVEFIVEDTGVDPQEVAQAATRLAETEGVVAFGMGQSLLDCPVNAEFYEQNGFNVMLVGVPNECYQSPSIAPISVGPAYSSLGAVRYLVDNGAEGTIVVALPNAPGAEAVGQIALSYAEQQGLETVSRIETVPIADPAALAQSLVAQAGDGGGVVLSYVPPEAVKILNAAEQQGLIDRVMWASTSSLNDTSVPEAIGSAWDERIFINSEVVSLDSDGPDMQLYRAVMDQYAPDNPLNYGSQMGLISAKIFTDAVLALPEDELNKESINEAILNIKNYATDMLCKPYYFQEMRLHIPNNTDWIVTPQGGEFVEAEGCTEIPATTPDLEYVRQFEAENDVNEG